MNNYNEQSILKDIEAHIESTYSQHYSGKGVQVLDLLEASQCVSGFLRGSAIKYACRYGKKDGRNEKDLIKAIHCLVLLIYFERQDKLDLKDKWVSKSTEELIAKIEQAHKDTEHSTLRFP